MGEPKPAFGYGRVSQLAAGQDGSLPTQRRRVDLAAELGGYQIVAWFDDPDVSAFSGKRRPGYEQMMGRLEEIRGGALIFYRLDRFCRRLTQFTQAFEECQRHGVALVSATEPIDTSTPIGIAMMEILMVFAQLEARTTQARLRDHHATLADAGRFHGGRLPIGWRYDPDTKTVALVPEEAEFVRAMAKAAVSGWSAKRLADAVNAGEPILGVPPAHRGGAWDHSTVLGVLRSPRLAGDRVHKGGVASVDAFPPILSRRQFARLQANLRTRGPGRPPSLLGGLLRCGNCDAPMFAGGGGIRSYTCKEHCGRGCSVGVERADQWAVKELFRFLASTDLERRMRQHRTTRKQDPARKHRARLEAKLARAQTGYINGLVTETQLRQTKTGVAAELAALERDEGDPLAGVTAAQARKLPDLWKRLTDDEKRRALRVFVQRITVPVQETRRARNLDDMKIEWTL